MIAIGINCAPFITDLFLYCYESQFIAKLRNDSSKSDLTDKYNNTYQKLDYIFTAFYKITNEIYPTELTLNKGNNNSLKCPFLDLYPMCPFNSDDI